jgi:hypothetical protein
MNKSEKQNLLSLISAENLPEAIAELKKLVAPDHPDLSRVTQLEKRLRELSERIDLGTLNKEDIARIRSRITGGLRDVVQEYKPQVKTEAVSKEAKSTFKLELRPEEEEKPKPQEEMGFRGELEYVGSPSKKERNIELLKTYGAAFHQVTQALKKAGMTMEKADRSGGRISATLPPTSSGKFGEVIEVWVKPTVRGRTKVHVVVDSASPTTMMDFGRHASKLNLLFSYLS